jgi:hypothetical protein
VMELHENIWQIYTFPSIGNRQIFCLDIVLMNEALCSYILFHSVVAALYMEGQSFQ